MVQLLPNPALLIALGGGPPQLNRCSDYCIDGCPVQENAALDEKIHHLLLLLLEARICHNLQQGARTGQQPLIGHRSPHLQARAAQECLEGLLYRCEAKGETNEANAFALCFQP